MTTQVPEPRPPQRETEAESPAWGTWGTSVFVQVNEYCLPNKGGILNKKIDEHIFKHVLKISLYTVLILRQAFIFFTSIFTWAYITLDQ